VRASGALASIGRLVRSGAEIVVEAAADERTGQAIDRLAGPEWRWAARAASVAVGAAREALAPPDDDDPAGVVSPDQEAVDAGEPSRLPPATQTP
jgi:hypothetical protein